MKNSLENIIGKKCILDNNIIHLTDVENETNSSCGKEFTQEHIVNPDDVFYDERNELCVRCCYEIRTQVFG